MIFIIMIGLTVTLTIGGLAVTIITIKNMNRETGELEGIEEEDPEIGQISSREFIPVKNVYGPIVEVAEGEYMLVIETGPKNFFLLNEEGFDNLDHAFAELCLSLDEDEEIIGYVANEFLDERSYFEGCRSAIKNNKEYYVRRLMNHILDFFEKRTEGQLLRRNFIILSYNVAFYAEQIAELKTEESIREMAADKLLDRAGLYVEILESKLGITTKVLTGFELIEVIYKHLNKNLASELTLKDMIEQESFNMYISKMNEKVKHINKRQQIELSSLDYQKHNKYIQELQDDFEKRLNRTIEEEEEFYKKKTNQSAKIYEDRRQLEEEAVEEDRTFNNEEEFMSEEEFIEALQG